MEIQSTANINSALQRGGSDLLCKTFQVISGLETINLPSKPVFHAPQITIVENVMYKHLEIQNLRL